MKKYLFFVSVLFIVFSCDQSEEITDFEDAISEDISDVVDLPSTFFNYANPDLPNHFLDRDVTGIDNTPNNNPVTDEGATLGRVLFYDRLLSANNTIACASCHLQENGFADPNALSTGFQGGLTGRNSMGLANARYYNNGRFFWDERAGSLEEQVLMPIQDEVEMGLTLNELVSKVQDQAYYEPLFRDAFGTTEVTSDRIASAMAQFIRAMVSYESKFDEGLTAANGNENADFNNFTELENIGKDLFFSGRTQCSNCHESATFSGDEVRNNGLDAVLTDLGVGGTNGNNNDNGQFKVNSLRNIAVTGPYMHDGRFNSLREVVQFYNSGIQSSPNLDRRLRGNNGTPLRMNLNGQEIDALVAFLSTLTDNSFLSGDKFTDPFVVN